MAGRSGHREMPLTPFQSGVLEVIAANRSEESHFAGGLVLNAGNDSARFSNDFDIFHELAEEVTRASEVDAESLRAAGYSVKPLRGEWNTDTTFRSAVVSLRDHSVDIDWAADSAYRFFPIQRDPILGWRLHLFDMATNKALALCSRTETRDYIDIVELHKTFSLSAIVWAACGKDPGFTPHSLLKMMLRFAKIDPAQLDMIKARDIDPVALKTAWIEMTDNAFTEMTTIADSLPDTPIGVAFVDSEGIPGWIGDDSTLAIHAPSIRGCLPVVSGGRDR